MEILEEISGEVSFSIGKECYIGIRKLIGILLIGASLLGIYGWETWGKEKFFYDDVLVLRQNLERGTVIEENMLTVKKMNVDETYIPYEEREEIIGLQASGFLHKGIPLFKENFQEGNLTPDESKDRYGLCIPAEWIASKPGQLARGDKVLLFCGERLVTEAMISHIDRDGAIEVIVTKKNASDICHLTSEGLKLVLVCV